MIKVPDANVKIGGDSNTKRHRHSREQILFIMVCGILLLSLVQMAMQLYIFDKARSGINELEQIDIRSTQTLKARQSQMLQILHNQDQIESAANATLAKMLKMEATNN